MNSKNQCEQTIQNNKTIFSKILLTVHLKLPVHTLHVNLLDCCAGIEDIEYTHCGPTTTNRSNSLFGEIRVAVLLTCVPMSSH